MTSNFSSIRGRKFGPYAPYSRTLRSKVSSTIIGANSSHTPSEKPINSRKDDIDFNVDRTPSKNPRVVDPDELCVVREKVVFIDEVDVEAIEEVSTRVDLSGYNPPVNNISVLSTPPTSISSQDGGNTSQSSEIIKIKQELDFSSFLSREKTIAYSNDETLEDDEIPGDDAPPENDTYLIDISNNVSGNTVSNKEVINVGVEPEIQPCLNIVTNSIRTGNETSKYIDIQSTNKGNLNTAYRSSYSNINTQHPKNRNTHESKRAGINDCFVLLEDVCYVGKYRYAKLLQDALTKLKLSSHTFKDSPRKCAMMTISKPHNTVVNVTTEASSNAVCDSFEEIVAKKLTKKRELLGIKEDFICKNTSPISSPTKKLKLPVISPVKNNIPVKSLASKSSVHLRELSSPTDLLSSTINYCDGIQNSLGVSVASPSILTSTANKKKFSKRRVLSPPRKSLPLNEFKTNTPKTVSKQLDISVIVPDDVDKNECEAVRTVPLHPRIRMKFKEHCSCTVENCNHLKPSQSSPINTSKTTVKTPSATQAIKHVTNTVTPRLFQQSNAITITTSTVKPCHLPLAGIVSTPKVDNQISIPYSPNCTCNIINCPHVKQSPSPRKRDMLQLEPLYNKENSAYCSPCSPSKRWNRPSLLPILSPKSPRSKLTQTITTTIPNNLKIEFDEMAQDDFLEIDSDTVTASSCDETINLLPQIVHISSDDDDEDDDDHQRDEQLFMPRIKIECKMETTTNDSVSSQMTMDGDEDDDDNLQPSIKRQRKVSSKKRVESFISKPIKSPTFLKASEVKDTDMVPSTSGRIIKSVTKKQMLKLTKIFNLKRLNIAVNNLTSDTVDKLIDLCSSRETWSEKGILLKAGLSMYDIQRLRLSKMRLTNHEKYGFRTFLKRRDVFQSLSENRHAKKPKRELDFLKSQKKKMKDFMLAKEREERERKDRESIRRALLKINARFMNQSKFWCFLDQGSSPLKPIEL